MFQPNFRVKLDLSKFYNDARRFSWIFVDSTNMFQISHLKQHITELLNINEPFHLLLNENEYLPPSENIRILKENEIILVSPGSGLNSHFDLSINNHFDSITISPSEKNIQELENSFRSPNETKNLCQKQLKISSVTNISQNEKFDISTNLFTCPKRKRVRHRKKKITDEETVIQKKENELNKPKIINSYIIPFGKHIRFDDLEDNDEERKPKCQQIMNGTNTTHVSPSHELANLLSLSNNSTPVTFTNIKNTNIKVKEIQDPCEKVESHENKSIASTNNINLEKLLNIDFKTYPIMIEKPQLKDIIAFKMLKIGSDYTPQISDFIVAEILSYCPETSVYILKILRGLSEVQVPIGKFTVMEDTVEQTMNDTITLNYAQIMEPRSIFIHNTDKETTSNIDQTIIPDIDKTITPDIDKTIIPDINKAINC
ncbi:coilin-like [Apis dorsata]|uniref:coilin-like n=1 Tax=Apis dorsata TaxID=7462 RepID=UPI0003DF7F0A|nr:coilin-like [Apis dorsata]